ncbi:MAG TPA: hypothetical protein DEQ34_00055 [Balneolaceae bacterium]|nr:hypothetical protein [Balneolaceae bacterium]|tara:strand:+ start:142484 stop:142942 length:459 start_codon:yes stop_codon:yes gene_type:complete
MRRSVFTLLSVVLFFTACNDSGILNSEDSITQGIEGKVTFWEGDFMPGTPSGTVTPVQRVVYIYEATYNEQVNWKSSTFAEKVTSKLVKKVKSGKDGIYRAELPEGTYSVFVEEKDGLYANLWVSGGLINPFTVENDSVTEADIDITYKATY